MTNLQDISFTKIYDYNKTVLLSRWSMDNSSISYDNDFLLVKKWPIRDSDCIINLRGKIIIL